MKVTLKSFLAVKKRRFEFNLSFQQGYGVYKLSRNALSPAPETPACRTLFDCGFSHPRMDVLEPGRLSKLGPDFDLSIPCPVDSSSHAELLVPADHLPHPCGTQEADADFSRLASHQDDELGDTASVFEGAERRLSHEVCRKIELTDWEWCRSKSERTPRQVGLSSPRCQRASLQAPLGRSYACASAFSSCICKHAIFKMKMKPSRWVCDKINTLNPLLLLYTPASYSSVFGV